MNDKEEMKKSLIEKAGIYFENRDIENALLYQKKIYELDPDDIYSRGNLADLYLILKRYSEVLEIADGLPEDCWMRYLIMGHYHYQLNKKEDALKNYLKANELDSKHEKALFDLSHFYKDEKEYDKAFEYAFKILENDENDIEGLALLIMLYNDTEQYKKVIEYAKKALPLSSDRDDVIYQCLAFAYYFMGEYKKGEDCLVEAINVHNRDCFYVATLGQYLSCLNDERAAVYYKMAYEIDPTRPESCLALAMYYKLERDLKNAKKYYEEYLLLEECDPIVLF